MTVTEKLEIWDDSKSVPAVIINVDNVEVKRFDIWPEDAVPYTDIREIPVNRNPPFII